MPGVAWFQAGAVAVLYLTGGATAFGPEVFADVPADTREALVAAVGLTKVRTAFNAYILRFPDGRITLVYTGRGALDGGGLVFGNAEILLHKAEVADLGPVGSGSHMLGPEKFARLTRNGAGFGRVAL